MAPKGDPTESIAASGGSIAFRIALQLRGAGRSRVRGLPDLPARSGAGSARRWCCEVSDTEGAIGSGEAMNQAAASSVASAPSRMVRAAVWMRSADSERARRAWSPPPAQVAR